MGGWGRLLRMAEPGIILCIVAFLLIVYVSTDVGKLECVDSWGYLGCLIQA